MTVATDRRLRDRVAALHGPGLWTIAGFVLYVLGAFASLAVLFLFDGPLLAILGTAPVAGSPGLSVRNGLHAIAWGTFVVAVAMPLGRRLVPGIRFTPTGWLVLGAGLLLAGVVTTFGDEFVRARYGLYDPEYQGLSIFAGPALVAVALASWASLATPGEGALMPGFALLAAAAGLVQSLVPSIPGAVDGIDAGSLPLAVGFVVGVVYAAAAAVLVLRRVGRPAG